jgi:antirestriction protein ArdC
MSQKVYDIITDQMIGLLEKGLAPWKMPWSRMGGGMPVNSQNKPYRGINIWLLMAVAADRGYTCPIWMTYKQAEERGGQVRKGEKSAPVIFWKWIEKEDESGEINRFPFARYYSVFNYQQIDGLPEIAPAADDSPFSPIEKAERFMDSMPDKPALKHGGSLAFYRPATDTVQMPAPDQFHTPAGYYETLYHEVAHATGHPNRLNRFTLTDHTPFGSADYSYEELVAEMSASYIMGILGLEAETIENNAAYIQHWLGKLKSDRKMLISAAQAAQKAVDYIQNKTYQTA